jgi:hypothetical protein
MTDVFCAIYLVFGDAGLADLDAELEKLSMDSRRSPQRLAMLIFRSAGEFPTVQSVGRGGFRDFQRNPI